MRQGGERCGQSEAASRAAKRQVVRRSGKWCGELAAGRTVRREASGAVQAKPRSGTGHAPLPRRRARMGAAAPRTAFHTPPPAHSPRTAPPPRTPPKKKTDAPKSDGSIPQTTKNGARTPRLHPPPARTPSPLLPAPAANPVTTARPRSRPRPSQRPSAPTLRLRGKSRHHGTPPRQTPPPPHPPKKGMKKGRLRRSFFPRMSVGFPSDYFR